MRTQAILIDNLGPPEVLVQREVELPQPGPEQVHVRVEAAGVNFADLIMRMGLYGTVPPRPFSPGFEVSGRVVSYGSKVEGLHEGDRAVALLRHGGYAHDVVAEARNVFPIPDEFDWVTAAAVPVVFLTAWSCLFGVGRAAEGEKTLVLGAAGGVGTAAVQLARGAGLTVYGTAGTQAKRRFVTEELGAAACFDSRGDWEAPLREAIGDRAIDIALDPVGGTATASCRRMLAPMGRLVFYGMSQGLQGRRRNWLSAAWTWLRTPRFHPLSLVQPNLSVSGVHLLHMSQKEGLLRRAMEDMLPRLRSGELRPIVDSTFSLDREGAVRAHERIHARENLGKVVLVRDHETAGSG